MKSFKSYLLIAVFALTTVCAPNAFSNAVKPVGGIDVIVKKTPGTAARQTAKSNADGTFSVNVSAPGTYTISYASGKHKGEVIETFTATKAGRHDIAMNSIQNLKR